MRKVRRVLGGILKVFSKSRSWNILVMIMISVDDDEEDNDQGLRKRRTWKWCKWEPDVPGWWSLLWRRRDPKCWCSTRSSPVPPARTQCQKLTFEETHENWACVNWTCARKVTLKSACVSVTRCRWSKWLCIVRKNISNMVSVINGHWSKLPGDQWRLQSWGCPPPQRRSSGSRRSVMVQPQFCSKLY